ncbi:hypothetical protein EPN83_03255 [Patescibacteria group bacterium]|nr:MAG: hypothetical protein EPN83_03255 [Patescibacteria group bacterium]
MPSRSFFDFFPTPKFLEMPSPGLVLEDTHARCVEFQHVGDHIVLKRYGEETLPEGTLVSGEIKKPQELTTALTSLRKRFDLHYIRCVLPDEKAYLFQTKISRAGERDIRTAVEFTIEENVPLSLSEAVFDFAVLRDGGEGREPFEVAVSVVPEHVVRSFLDVYRSAELSPFHFEIESQAVVKAVVAHDDPAVYAVIHIFSRKVGVYVVRKNAVHFSATIPLSANALESGEFPWAGELVSEARKVISYWHNENEDESDRRGQPQALILSGKFADHPALAAALTPLGLPLKVADVWENVFSLEQFVPDLSREEAFEYAPVIGAALSYRSHL